MRTILLQLAALGLAVGAFAGPAAAADKGDAKVEKRVFELRVYYVAPGKMAALNERFRDHTNKLLEKHGMTLIGFWTPIDPKEADSKLIYLVAHPSEEAAKKNWAEFREDPEWKAAKEASEKNGRLVEKVVSTFLTATDYSALK
jgi:hypothetical protein